MNLTKCRLVLALAGVSLLAGCAGFPAPRSASAPQKLIVHDDGTMELNHKPVSDRDVVIYPDGFGGEKAAVRVRLEPLHPDFFRDTIVVVHE